MGAFSSVSAFKNIKANQIVHVNSGHIISVEKYGWNLVQLSLCAYPKGYVTLKQIDDDDDWAEDNGYYILPVVIIDAKKGIKNFYEFFKRYSKEEGWEDQGIVDKAKSYLENISKKYPTFIFDMREFYGMGEDTKESFKKDYDKFLLQAKDTIHYKYLQYNLDEYENIKWMINDKLKKQQKWIKESVLQDFLENIQNI
jgi:hypothetical protein